MNYQLLTSNDLIELTGAKLPSRQADVLQKHHITYVTRADNKIITTWAAVNTALCGNSSPTTPSPDTTGFNLEDA